MTTSSRSRVEASGRKAPPAPRAAAPRPSLGLRAPELLAGPSVFATWEEAELMEVPMMSQPARHG